MQPSGIDDEDGEEKSGERTEGGDFALPLDPSIESAEHEGLRGEVDEA
jgi:hypothetical protein